MVAKVTQLTSLTEVFNVITHQPKAAFLISQSNALMSHEGVDGISRPLVMQFITRRDIFKELLREQKVSLTTKDAEN